MSRLHKNKQYFDDHDRTAREVGREVEEGLALLGNIENDIVTFFGSHKLSEQANEFRHCADVAKRLGDRGYAIATGGGPGIMRAANRGATEAGVPSIGFQAELLSGEFVHENIYTHKYSFTFMFVRRFIMSIKSEALIFYPGGYGTLNELFEYVTLMQTEIADTVPIVCVGRRYWLGLFDWLYKELPNNNFLIDNELDLELLHLTDSYSEIENLIEGDAY